MEEKNIEEINAKISELLENSPAPANPSRIPQNIGAVQKSGKSIVCVVGMGYVGFPLAAIDAEKGY